MNETSGQERKTVTETKPADRKVRVVAVIDIGATAIRLVIAEIDEQGRIHTLETLSRAVHLGKDTFNKGRIQQSTIQECVEILKGFRQVMQEYGVTEPNQIRAVATSSVREAQNRDNFIDRVYIATNIPVRAIDEAEENRLTYMAVQSVMESRPELSRSDVLVVEVGGGSTELLLIQGGHVTYSNSYRLGSLRMRETLESYRAPSERTRTILGQHIERTIDQLKRDVPPTQGGILVAMAGDARFVASQISKDWNEVEVAEIDYKTFSAFAEKIIPITVEKLVQKYKMAYQEAETVGPAVLAYIHLARQFKVEKILVPKTSLRDGLLREAALQRKWTDAFAEEVVHSAVTLGHKYQFDEKHAQHVADTCMQIFKALQPDHPMDQRHELLLKAAALLHEIGGFISNRSHHKHSMYLILNSDLFGLTREDMTLIAQIARYHRRALPSATHEEYALLDRDSRITVSKLAAILRVADGLDRNHLQQVRSLSFSRDKDEFVITVSDVEDLTIERLAVKEKGVLFEEVYGMSIHLKESRSTLTGDSAHG